MKGNALTPREAEVQALFAQGLKLEQIAFRLGLSYGGVQRIKDKIVLKALREERKRDAERTGRNAAPSAGGHS